MAGQKDNKAQGQKEKTPEQLDKVIADFNTEIANLKAENAELNTEIADLDTAVAELKAKNDDLKAQVDELLADKTPVINFDGFRLAADDPFAAGALRAYLAVTNARQVQAPMVPFVIPYKDKAAARVGIQSYIIRAEGAGNTDRAAAAKKALEKIR